MPVPASGRRSAPFHPLADDDKAVAENQDGADEGIGAGGVSPDEIAKQEGPDKGGIFKRCQHRDGRLPHAF